MNPSPASQAKAKLVTAADARDARPKQDVPQNDVMRRDVPVRTESIGTTPDDKYFDVPCTD
jgi:hypothetical protein